MLLSPDDPKPEAPENPPPSLPPPHVPCLNIGGWITFAYLWVAAPRPPPAPLTGPAKEEGRKAFQTGRDWHNTDEVGNETFSQRVTPARLKRSPPRSPATAPPRPQQPAGRPAGGAHGGPVRAGSACGSGCAALWRSPAALPDGGPARARLPSGGSNAVPQPARCRLSALLRRSGAALKSRPGGTRRRCRTRAPRSGTSRTTASPRSPRRLLRNAAPHGSFARPPTPSVPDSAPPST